jgi:hypothetical protein
MGFLAGFLVEILLYLLVEVFLHWTGEIVLFLGTFGRRKPVFRMWGYKKLASPAAFQNSSIFLGFAFWLVVLLAFRFVSS